LKIAIIGAGAMGSLFGAYLSEGGNEVHLVDVWREHVDAINRDGLRIKEEDKERTVFLRALTDPGELGPQDLVVLFVKSYHTADAIKKCTNLLGQSIPVLTLQNGFGNAEIIYEIVGQRAKVIAGTTAHGATVLGPGIIRHAGRGETVIGNYGENNDKLVHDIAGEFNRCLLETRVSNNITGVIWGKLLVNVGINALTAICGVPNGKLLEIGGTRRLMQLLVSEGERVARARGVQLPYPDAWEKVQAVARATGSNRSSMLQDLERGRETEIDFINMAIVREGRKSGIPTPYNKFVSLLVKALEEKNKNRLW